MNKKLRVAVIGVGGISDLHLQGYREDPRAEIYALCDIDADRLAYMGKKYGCDRLYTDYNEMLKLSEIDAVSVCTWNAEHHKAAIAALNAGKHVLCEKPMALNAEYAQQMKDAADRNGKLLMIGFVRRFGNDADILSDMVKAGFLGDVYYAKATYLRRNGNPGRWFGDKAYAGGGPLIDLGVHVIDLVRYLMDRPKPVAAYGVTYHKLGNRPDIKGGLSSFGYDGQGKAKHDYKCDVEDLASAMIRFDNGATLAVEASFSLNIKADTGKIELFGDKGGAKLDPELELYGTENGYMTNVQLTNPTALSFDGLFSREIAHFVDCCLNGTPCRAPAEDGVWLMKILDSVYESARSGHQVEIK